MRSEEVNLAEHEIKSLKKLNWQFERRLRKAKNEEHYNNEVYFLSISFYKYIF